MHGARLVETPHVSVIIPLYNLGRFVGEAIESTLAQTIGRNAIEVIVVDDGSTDGGGDVARRYPGPVRCHRQENRGLSAARNAGLRLSQAPYLTFLDADDRVLPDKLEAQLAGFAAHPEAGLVYTGCRHIDESGQPLPQRGWSRYTGDVLGHLLLGNLIHPHTALVRRELVERAGGFDESLTSVEDWDLWLRISRAGALWHCIDRPLAEYRVRPGAMHDHPQRMLDNRLRVLDKFFADATLPRQTLERRPAAFQSAYLAAACDYFRSGDRPSGAHWFHAAVAAHPEYLTEPSNLRRFCRWMLPPGYQREEAIVAHWPLLAPILAAALDDLFARPNLEASIRRVRARARLAYWRTVARFSRKRIVARLRGGRADAMSLPPGAIPSLGCAP
jgi:glycosyltransferase involved in cell wall biosynthesis